MQIEVTAAAQEALLAKTGAVKAANTTASPSKTNARGSATASPVKKAATPIASPVKAPAAASPTPSPAREPTVQPDDSFDWLEAAFKAAVTI